MTKDLLVLGYPITGTAKFFYKFLSSCLAKVVATQDSIPLLEDPQVELHLLRSCLGSCKIVHLLRTVPFAILHSFLELILKSVLYSVAFHVVDGPILLYHFV